MIIVTRALNTLSAMSCRVTRLPRAPSARRIAISLARATLRAMARLATLAQTSKSRQNIAANTRSSSRRLVRAISSASGMSRTLQPAFVPGCSTAIPLASVCIRAVAPSMDSPAFIRPTTRRNRASRGGPLGKRGPRYDTRISHGAQNVASASGTTKSAGITPITRQSRPSTWTVRSTICGSAPRVCHRRWLRTMTGSPLDACRDVIDAAPSYSPAWNVRPSMG